MGGIWAEIPPISFIVPWFIWIKAHIFFFLETSNVWWHIAKCMYIMYMYTKLVKHINQKKYTCKPYSSFGKNRMCGDMFLYIHYAQNTKVMSTCTSVLHLFRKQLRLCVNVYICASFISKNDLRLKAPYESAPPSIWWGCYLFIGLFCKRALQKRQYSAMSTKFMSTCTSVLHLFLNSEKCLSLSINQ